jgi:hypothetical protein
MQLAMLFGEQSQPELQESLVKKVRRAPRQPAFSAGEIQQWSIFDLLALPEAELGPVVWTDDDIDILREKLLFEACSIFLDKRAALGTRKDRWAWIMSDEVLPFSFKVCISAAGVDCDRFRESLIDLCRRQGVIEQLQIAA